MDIPIIIYHLGYKDYVTCCLKQALKYNNNVILITDAVNEYSNIDGLIVINNSSYSSGSNLFRKKYIHLSNNSPVIELICIQRWISIYEYMYGNNIKRAFICDSDVLIYDNITEIDNKYLLDYEHMLCSSPSKNLTGGQSIWNLSKLKEFISFIFVFYNTQKDIMIKWYKTYQEPGGICDMTLLYYFSHNETVFKGLRLPEFPYFENDLTQIFNEEFTFDLHLASPGNHIYPDEWEVDDRKNKNIKYIDSKPYCYNKRINKDIRFILLHFQGNNKNYMKEYYIKTE